VAAPKAQPAITKDKAPEPDDVPNELRKSRLEIADREPSVQKENLQERPGRSIKNPIK
jgi:hypothetical protein